MASKDRERQLARERYERQQARRAADEAKRRQRTKLAAIVTAAVVVVAGAVWWGVSRGDDEVTATPETSTSPTPSPTPTAAPIDCTEAPAAQPEAKQYAAPPEQRLVLDGTRTYGVTLETNCGNVKIEFDAVQAPTTVNAFIQRANDGFYNDTPCHRLTTEGIFVLQCGDPTGTGTGGPGYQIPDENLPEDAPDNYPAGTVAMANSGPNTNGSQFFLVYENTTLPPNYTIFGKIIEGLDVVQSVAAQGVEGGGADGPPAQPIGILKALTYESFPAG